MMWDGDGMGAWGFVFMGISTLLFLGLIVWVVLVLVRHFGDQVSRQSSPQRPTAEQTLAERYARGEIDDEEYHRRREVLRHNS